MTMTLSRSRNSCLAAIVLLAACAPRVAGSAARPLRSAATLAAGSMDQSGFEKRMLAGKGRFLTQADIAARRVNRVSDLFRTETGITVVPMDLGGATLAASGGPRVSLTSPSLCLAEVYLDGVRQTATPSSPPFDINSISVKLLRGIEIYRGSEAPAQYSSSRNCPVVLFWTRTTLQ
jgi:outer membrane cobalamin receptor